MTLNEKMLNAINDNGLFMFPSTVYSMEDLEKAANECEAIAVEWANEQNKITNLDEVAKNFSISINTKEGTVSRLNAIEWFKAGFNYKQSLNT